MIAVGPMLLGMPMKQASFLALMIQISVLILIMYYSRIMTPPGDHQYFASTAVLLNEIIKLAISLTFSLHEASRTLGPQTPVTVLFEQVYHQVFSGDGWKLALPAVLYTLENTLQYTALSNLDAVHFQVLYHLKILTTAVFTVLLLGRTLSIRRWLSFVLLTIGVSLVSLPSFNNPKDITLDIHDFNNHFFPRSVHELGQVMSPRSGGQPAAVVARGQITRRSASYEGIAEDLDSAARVAGMNYPMGLAAVLMAAVISGLAGVYFEKVLKSKAASSKTGPVSVWTRNVQLSFYSLFPALFIGVIGRDGTEIVGHGFFDGYNAVVWMAIVVQAVGGILASMCINYADNLAKNFATSLGVVISFLFSVLFLDFHVNLSFAVGTILVLTATYLYSLPERKRARPPPITIAEYETTTIVGSTSPLSHAVPRAGGRLSPDASVGLSTSRPSSPLTYHGRGHSHK
ncbi:nucleotide-sugar transporter-domain-containing protein [Dichotomopilus funicola]|uniref:Nucleotide-sugar transporter-domain-containing protein n=1 Tax=Dichotomopilus funicola TaxID=1934379 RepID=A0AAN6V9D9_9PEZI|nr:nucleotide-sugar transporter-domain-containing protein [Dichotomopilus funicola]